MGEAFPFASPTEHIDTQTHFSLHEWIISFGDRLGCKQWLAAYFSHRVGKHWTSVPDADLLDTLLHCQKHGQTLNEAIQQESDLETLVTLLREAKLLQTYGTKRKRHATERNPVTSAKLSRCQRRNVGKRQKRADNQKRKRKLKRQWACRQAEVQLTKPAKGTLKIGSWNTRGMGAMFGKDPVGKEMAIVQVMQERKWNVALLTDLRYKEDGFRELKKGNDTWILIHCGRVGVALDPFWANKWRNGGAQMLKGSGTDMHNRFFGVPIYGEGWKPGFCLIPVYAPLASKTSLGSREKFRDQLGRMLDKTSGRLKPILGGDFNGEVGAGYDKLWRHVLGPFGDHRRTRGGEELLVFCEQEGLIVANTFSKQEQKSTWFHPKDGTAHALDHFLIRKEDRRWCKRVHTVHHATVEKRTDRKILGRPMQFASAPWLEHTDHDPIEMVWTVGKDWKAEAEDKIALENKPDVLRLLGSSLEAKDLREKYSSHVAASLSSVEGSALNWDSLVAIMLDSALKILGPTPKRCLRPWFKGKETELANLESLAHNIELELREARRTKSPNVATLLTKRRQTSKTLQSKKKQWEALWWEELAAKAEKAGQTGNEFEFWQVCRLLGLRESGQHRSLAKRTVADPVADREAWKSFLQGIHADTGRVNPDVWQHVSSVPTDVALFNSPLSWKEFSSALSAMHNGKRGGIDLVSVEMIKYGGSLLQAEVFRIIGDMWEEASRAHPGHETKTWCASTTTGVCIPVFKSKGDRTDRNNYRNLFMLSVAAKL